VAHSDGLALVLPVSDALQLCLLLGGEQCVDPLVCHLQKHSRYNLCLTFRFWLLLLLLLLLLLPLLLVAAGLAGPHCTLVGPFVCWMQVIMTHATLVADTYALACVIVTHVHTDVEVPTC
jgi:hypothetical protein